MGGLHSEHLKIDAVLRARAVSIASWIPHLPFGSRLWMSPFRSDEERRRITNHLEDSSTLPKKALLTSTTLAFAEGRFQQCIPHQTLSVRRAFWQAALVPRSIPAQSLLVTHSCVISREIAGLRVPKLIWLSKLWPSCFTGQNMAKLGQYTNTEAHFLVSSCKPIMPIQRQMQIKRHPLSFKQSNHRLAVTGLLG